MPRLSAATSVLRQQALFRAADEQAGYFTPKQAEAAGFSRRVQQHHARTGHWLHIEHGLYRLALYPETLEEGYVRLALWSRNSRDEPQAVMAFETAMAIHDLSDLAPSRTHLIVPPGFRKRPPAGVVLHKAEVPPTDLITRSGYRVTTPLRTLIDLAGSGVSPEHLHLGLKDALGRGLIRRRTFEQRLRDPALPRTVRDRLEAALANV